MVYFIYVVFCVHHYCFTAYPALVASCAVGTDIFRKPDYWQLAECPARFIYQPAYSVIAAGIGKPITAFCLAGFFFAAYLKPALQYKTLV